MQQSPWTEFSDHYRKILTVGSISGLVGWDQEVIMPSGAVEMRGYQRAYLETHLHGLSTDQRFFDVIEELNSAADLSPAQKAAVVWQWKKVKRQRRIPLSLVEEMAHSDVQAQGEWFNARKQSDFKAFLPTLERTVRLRTQLGEHLKEGDQTVYDALLEGCEPNFPSALVSDIFADLKKQLVPLVAEIVGRQKIGDGKVDFSLGLDEQKKLNRVMLERMTFDFSRGRLDESAHPFCGGPSWQDVRLTTRYRADDWTNSLYSVLHEGGHGLYEQGVGTLAPSPSAEVPSFGMHESQSRFWENCIGRSRPFAEFAVGLFAELFPHAPQIQPEQYFSKVNSPRYSYIRVDSDEVTYNLHILIRSELEQDLFRGAIKVADVRDAWNAKVESYLKVPAPSDAEGVLQDVHWAWGLFGYFPTYTIGNLISAQLHQTLSRDFDLPTLVRRGEFEPVKKWLFEKIHSQGCLFSTRDLVEKVTGEKISVTPFLDYLREKFPT